MRTPKLAVALGLAAALAGAGPNRADECRHTALREEALDAAGANVVRIDAAAGYLHVEGREGATEVRVTGTACAPDEETLAELTLEAERRGSEIRIRVQMPEVYAHWGWGDHPRLDLDVEVPPGLAVEIDDGSGEVVVRRVAAVEVEDGSGEIEIEQVAGDVWIEDGSGEVDVRQVGGAVLVESDGSGSLDIRQVDGDVEIYEDGSGSIEIADVRGNVSIDEDGSGSIVIERVGGSVRIGEDGSGSIQVDEVTGDFTVVRDGSGGISHRRVGGRVSVPSD